MKSGEVSIPPEPKIYFFFVPETSKNLLPNHLSPLFLSQQVRRGPTMMYCTVVLYRTSKRTFVSLKREQFESKVPWAEHSKNRCAQCYYTQLGRTYSTSCWEAKTQIKSLPQVGGEGEEMNSMTTGFADMRWREFWRSADKSKLNLPSVEESKNASDIQHPGCTHGKGPKGNYRGKT